MKISRRSHLVVVPDVMTPREYERAHAAQMDEEARLADAEQEGPHLPELCDEDDHEWIIEVCSRCWLARTT